MAFEIRYYKDDPEFVPEFPCLLWHPVSYLKSSPVRMQWESRNYAWSYKKELFSLIMEKTQLVAGLGHDRTGFLWWGIETNWRLCREDEVKRRS